MTTNNIINEAVKMIETHDWNWRYADYGYDSRYNTAKADMKAFVKLVKTIDSADVPEDEARTKRKNDIKRRGGCSSKQGMAPDRLKLKSFNDNPYRKGAPGFVFNHKCIVYKK